MTKKTRTDLFKQRRKSIEAMDDDDFDTITTFSSTKMEVDPSKKQEIDQLMSHPNLGLHYEELNDDGKKDGDYKPSTFSYIRMNKKMKIYYAIISVFSLAIIALIIAYGIILF